MLCPPKPKIQAKIQSPKAKKVPIAAADTAATAAEIPPWSASVEPRSKVNKTPTSQSQPSRTKQMKKPQSLAAVDLPTFPRPQ